LQSGDGCVNTDSFIAKNCWDFSFSNSSNWSKWFSSAHKITLNHSTLSLLRYSPWVLLSSYWTLFLPVYEVLRIIHLRRFLPIRFSFHLIFICWLFLVLKNRLTLSCQRIKISAITEMVFRVHTFNFLKIYFLFALVAVNLPSWNTNIDFFTFIDLQCISCLIHILMLEKIQELLFAGKWLVSLL
jgi:hypothetical protein